MKRVAYFGFFGFISCFCAGQNVGIGTDIPGSKLTVKGSFAGDYELIEGNTVNLNANNFFVSWTHDNTGVIHLPAAQIIPNNFKGRIYHIKNNTTKYLLNVEASGSETINVSGGSSVSSVTVYPEETVQLISTGNISGITWQVVNQNISNSPNHSFWKLAGNGNTDPATHYLGTTDVQPLIVRTSGTEKLRILPDGNIGVGITTPGSRFTVNGSFASKFDPITTTNYNMNTSALADKFYLSWKPVSTATGTLTLPAAGNYQGRLYHVKNSSSSARLNLVPSTGSESIEITSGTAVAGIVLNPGETVNVISTGAATGVTWEIISHTMSSIPMIPPGSNSWDLNGNAGTTPTTHFLGTTDSRDLVFKTNGFEVLRMTSLRNLDFPTQTNASTSLGIITKDGVPFIHNTRGASGSAINNTAIGLDALNLATRGDSNTAAGVRALANNNNGYNNTAIGSWASEKNTNGHANVAFGARALSYNTSGTGNTAIGALALERIIGSGNIALGKSAMQNCWFGENNIAIGILAGDSSVASQCIYIGSSAGRKNTFGQRLIINDQSLLAPLLEGNFSENTVIGGLEPRSVKISNDLVVARNLDVNNDLRVKSSLTLFTDSAAKLGANVWSTPSDIRVKKNIHSYTGGLKEILAINPVTFQYDDNIIKGDQKIYVGIIAQEVEKILPATVTQTNLFGIKDLRQFNGSELFYTLINAVKEQQEQIEMLKNENSVLKLITSKMMQLENDIDQIKSYVIPSDKQSKIPDAFNSK